MCDVCDRAECLICLFCKIVRPPGGYGNLFNDPAEIEDEGLRTQLQEWHALGKEFGHSLHQLAVAFAALPMVGTVILGMGSEAEVDACLDVVEGVESVPRALWVEAQARGMITRELAL